MNLLRKWWAWCVLAAALAATVLGVRFWMERNAQPEYRTIRIERGPITAAVAASGTLNPVVSVQVGSQVSGQLREILADFNSEVKAGQLIARIDPETFEYKVRQAQSDLDAARSLVLTQEATIVARRAEVSKAEVDAAEAGRDLERKKQLVEKGYIAAAERDKARSVYNSLLEQVNMARAQAGVAVANARNAEAVVKQRAAVLAQARVDLERTAIRAPVNGIVIKRSVERGQTVAASLQAPELFVIAENLTDMQVDAAIDESEIGRIRLGQQATFTVDAFPGRSFEGTVRQIRKAAQNVNNVVTYTVVISAANPNRELLPGMTANVRVVTDTRNDVLKVANSALRYRPPGLLSPQKGAGGAPADAPPAAVGSGGPGGQGRALRERLEKELQLDETQKAKLETIFGGMRAHMMAAREAPETERQKMLEKARAEMRAQIGEILHPDQKARYAQIAGDNADRRGTRGRIYSLDEKKQPRLLEVRFGLTDGTSTEVISPDLQEGMEIITGSTQRQRAEPKAPPPRLF